MSRYKSTLELYREPEKRYSREPLPYDLTDVFDLGVWVALVLYLQSDALADSASTTARAGNAAPSLWELEQDLSALASNAKAVLGNPQAERLATRDGQAAALTVLAALFPPVESEEQKEERSYSAVPNVPSDLWQAACGAFESSDEKSFGGGEAVDEAKQAELQEDDAGAEGTVVEESLPGEIRQRLLVQPLAAVIYAARLALGGTLTQSEAARTLGVTSARLHKLAGQGRYRHLRVGRTVLLLEDEVSIGTRDRRKSASN